MLLPLLALVQDAKASIDELMSDAARAFVEQLLVISAQEVAGAKHAGRHTGMMKPEDAEIARLKRELAKTRAKRDILKKNHWVLRQGANVRFAAIARHCGVWPLRWMCEALMVTPAGFHAWLKRPESERAIHDRVLTGVIRTSFAESDRTYGARRVRRDLRAWGYCCGLHRVQRLMSAAQLVARPKRRRRPCDTGVRPEHAIAPNLLERKFEAPAPNCKWPLTSRTYGQPKAGCTSRSCWTCSRVVWWGGR